MKKIKKTILILMILYSIPLITCCSKKNSSGANAPAVNNNIGDSTYIETSAFKGLAELDIENEIQVSRELFYSDFFRYWLYTHGYEDLAESKGVGGGSSSCVASNVPVIILHGIHGEGYLYQTTIDEYLARGYKECELYAPTWGKSIWDAKGAGTVRRFIQAVKEFTGKTKVNVVGHSAGVVMGRKAITGGKSFIMTGPGSYVYVQLGPNILDSIDTFISVAGVNRGVKGMDCLGGESTDWINFRKVMGCPDSDFLQSLNKGTKGNYQPERIASYIYSIYSDADCIGGDGSDTSATCSYIYGEHTGVLTGSDGLKKIPNAQHSTLIRIPVSVDAQIMMMKYHVVQ